MVMRRQQGFTYLGVLVAMAIVGVGLTAASEVWVTTARRQKLEQLRWAGEQFRQAIGSYHDASPGAVKVYPRSFEDLLDDRRYLTVRRHLRSVYVNPFTSQADWEKMPAPDGGIRGVRVQVATDSGVQSFTFAHDPQAGGP